MKDTWNIKDTVSLMVAPAHVSQGIPYREMPKGDVVVRNTKGVVEVRLGTFSFDTTLHFCAHKKLSSLFTTWCPIRLSSHTDTNIISPYISHSHNFTPRHTRQEVRDNVFVRCTTAIKLMST